MPRNLVLAADVGFQATGLALFDVSVSPARLVSTLCVRPKKDTKRKHLLVADSDADRVARMARGVAEFVRANKVTQMVAELPSGGAQGARANRAMGIATGFIATLTETMGLASEWYTPNETRDAAVGKPQKLPKVPKDATKTEAKAIKKQRNMLKKGIKERVIAAMQERYPDLQAIEIYADLEHIADACACFCAAENGNLVRAAAAAANDIPAR
jgi:Holliday junction resolvasome RuvABC endonuclease subunit